MVLMLSKFYKVSQKSIQGYIEFLNHEGALAKAALKIEVLFSLLLYLRNLVTCVNILSLKPVSNVQLFFIYLFAVSILVERWSCRWPNRFSATRSRNRTGGRSGRVLVQLARERRRRPDDPSRSLPHASRNQMG
jgi:hypothetical protein